jgi:hypothetical protein
LCLNCGSLWHFINLSGLQPTLLRRRMPPPLARCPVRIPALTLWGRFLKHWNYWNRTTKTPSLAPRSFTSRITRLPTTFCLRIVPQHTAPRTHCEDSRDRITIGNSPGSYPCSRLGHHSTRYRRSEPWYLGIRTSCPAVPVFHPSIDICTIAFSPWSCE